MDNSVQFESLLMSDELPMMMAPKLAKVLHSSAKALLLQELQNRLQANRLSKNTKSFKDGRWWASMTLGQWHEQFVWLSERTIQRYFRDLAEQGIVIVGNFSENRFDQTNWYTLDYQALNQLMQEKG
ncbi:hypothetical protein ACLUWF_06090 [Limosilactobacillus mucosae]|uniref:hypothetical protein n=1 Tax=Limosilactobacillus mucosae TaxID=97478 RepID=UPI00399567FF